MSSSGTSSGLNLAGLTQGSRSLTGSNVTITSPFSNCFCCRPCAAAPTVGWSTSSDRFTTDEEEPRSDLAGLLSSVFRSVSTSTLCESVTWVP